MAKFRQLSGARRGSCFSGGPGDSCWGVSKPDNPEIANQLTADPHHFDADPDPTFQFDADPDPSTLDTDP